MVRDEIKKLLGSSAEIEIPKDKSLGDYSTNIALILAKQEKRSPMEIAKEIESRIKNQELGMFEKIEVVKPGFINFFLSKEYLIKHLNDKVKNIGKGLKINVEFISANPTGPLTLGNGRGGFGGDILANILRKAGFDVVKEFYINDRGGQIEKLKKGLYKGEKREALEIQKENQKLITEKLKINFDVWFSEKSLYKKKEVAKVLDYLKKKNLVYKKEGALWFKSTNFGDDKDRVLIKENGEETYFLSDIAYLKNKFSRGFKKLIIFLGADHAGYVARMKAAVEALGYKKEQLDFIIMQLVRLMEKGQEVKMSKRAGVFIELKELINEVGLDVARFFFLARAANSHLVFNLELAKKKSQENPVYYVQYAYARINSILAKSNPPAGGQNLKLLDSSEELNLIKQLIRFPEVVEDTAKDYQIQRLPQYSIDLAESFHRFYEKCQVISDNKETTRARLALLLATKIVFENTFNLMGISAPEKM